MRITADTEGRNNRHPYQILIDSFSDAMYVIDRNFRVIYVNSAFQQWITDYKLEIIGHKVVEAFPFLPKQVFDKYQQVFDEEKVLIFTEIIIIRKREYNTEIRIMPVFRGGNIAQIITIIHENLEKRKITRKFN